MFFVDVNKTYAGKIYTIAYIKYITQPLYEFKVNQNF